MKNKAVVINCLIVTIILGYLMISCNRNWFSPTPNTDEESNATLVTHSPTNTASATTTSNLNLRPTLKTIPTITFTYAPTLPSPTMTPPPTFAPEEVEKLVVELFNENGGCELPCWWGFVPGKTTWLKARNILERFAKFDPRINQDASEFYLYIYIPVAEEISSSPLPQIYRVRDGIITSMEVYIGEAHVYPLSDFLNNYGPPQEIWIHTYRNVYRNENVLGVLAFEVVLFYPERGILALYGAKSTDIKFGKVWGCKMGGTPSKFGLWSPKERMTFDEAAKEFRVYPPPVVEIEGLQAMYDEGVLFLPIEEATSMDVQEFYQTYKMPNSSVCMQTPTELWPEQ
jgi:hypothetical protein